MRPDQNLPQLLDTALALHQSGNLERAAVLYAQILAKNPGHTDALFLFGVLHHQLGRHREAVDLLLKAIAKNKRNPDWYNTLGEAYRALGQVDQAIKAYRRALKLEPRLVAALGNLGLALQNQGQLIEAAQCYEKVLRVDPRSLPALVNMGSISQEQGNYPEAFTRYQAALKVDPHYVDAHFNLGLLHHEQCQYEEARNHLQLATQLAPENPEAWLALGKVYLKSRLHEDALMALEQALALRHDFPEAAYQLAQVLEQGDRQEEATKHLRQVVSSCRQAVAACPGDVAKLCLLGNALRGLGQRNEAVACFRGVIALRRGHGEALFNLGSLLLEGGNSEEGLHLFEQVIKLQPNNSDAYLNRGLALQKLGQLEAARESLVTALHLRPEYPLADLNLGVILQEMGLVEDSLTYTRRAIETMPDDSRAHSNYLLALNYTIRPAELVYRAHIDFGERYAGSYRKMPRSWPNDCNTNRALRIGYVSPDFRNHSVAYFFEPTLSAHDRSGFEVFCYSDVIQGDAVTQRLQQYPVRWRDIHQLSDQQVCERIREDGIDILVDLAGHTAKNRMMVFARKPAPVQVTYIGYPNTTGLEEVDYRITDMWADPAGLTDPYYTEQLIRLPHGFLCYRPDEDGPMIANLPATALGHITFGTFNNLTKVTDTMIALWSRVLTAVPNSRFFFKSKALADKAVRERITQLFAEQGVAQSRLRLLAQIPSTEGHLAAYNEIDIALDTFPYHGTTTTFEALWMGVPVVTLAGQVHVARVGVSILSRLGLSELIAAVPEDYVRIAVELAGNLPKLQELRQSMRQRMKERGLMDADTITQDLELAYRDMWRCYCGKQ